MRAHEKMIVRFYQDSISDMDAFVKAQSHNDYGFATAREFIIACINNNNFQDMKNIDLLADKIATRLLNSQSLQNKSIHREPDTEKSIQQMNLKKSLDLYATLI